MMMIINPSPKDLERKSELLAENDVLKARCARLRAALAGVVNPVDPKAMDDVDAIDRKEHAMRVLSMIYGNDDLIMLNALHVLRETAPSKEVTDGV